MESLWDIRNNSRAPKLGIFSPMGYLGEMGSLWGWRKYLTGYKLGIATPNRYVGENGKFKGAPEIARGL